MNEPSSVPKPTAQTSAWWVFAGFGVLFLIYGIYAFTLPYFQPSHWDDITTSEETVAYIANNFRWLGMLSAMFGVLTLAVAYGGLRRSQTWAWYTLLSYPIFLLMAIVYTWPGLMWSPFLIVSVVALWVAFGSVFQRS
jgi:uncharacterized membrane protein HdeD (DUF308 family)